MNKPIVLLFFWALMMASPMMAQQSPLHKIVTVKIVRQPVEVALLMIGSAGGVHFSYNSDIIPVDSLVTLNVAQQRVIGVLHQLFLNKYDYKTTGEHIIILRKKSAQPAYSAEEKKLLTLRGTILDLNTGKPLSNASIYNLNGKESALSDTEGQFMLRLSPREELINLAISREGYEDTILFFKNTSLESIALTPKPQPSTIPSLVLLENQGPGLIEMEQSQIVHSFVKIDMLTHARNIGFYKQRPLQMSLLPYAGTNYRLSGSISNQLSINVLSGYVYGVNGVEIGGVLNIDRQQMRGVQVGGIGNMTGKYTLGLQAAGIFNQAQGKVEGFQIGGIYNVVKDSFVGVQVAGIGNWQRPNFKGVQVAGIFNVADEVEGVQLSGVLNKAKKVHGLQIGIINIADTVSIASIGLFNFIKKGFHQISLQTDELGSIEGKIAFGTNHLYTLLGVQVLPGASSTPLAAVIGLGTRFFFQ